MAAKLQCEICGGKLVGKPGGIFECESCGTEYSTEWAKAKIQEIKGTVKVEGTVDVKGSVHVEGPVKVEGAANAQSLIKRGNLALEDWKWDDAKQCFNDALKIEPENAEAYFGLAMAKAECSDRKSLRHKYIYGKYGLPRIRCKKDLSRAMQFGDDELKKWISDLNGETEEYDRKKQIEKEQEKKKQEVKLISFAESRTHVEAYEKMIVAGTSHTVGLKDNGTVVAAGENHNGKNDVKNWTNIVAVAEKYGHIVGLKSDRTVIALGQNNEGQCNVKSWTNIVAITAGGSHTVGLKSDGTVVAVGGNECSQCNVNNWKDIVAIEAGNQHTVGLKTDGTVVAVGGNGFGQRGVYSWKDIVAIATGSFHTIGLKANGTVVAVGNNDKGQCDVRDWRDIIAIEAGNQHTVGLKTDGTVVAVGDKTFGRCDVENWTDIVAIAAGDWHTVGLKSDGTVVAVGSNHDFQCNVKKWRLFRSEAEKESSYNHACSLQNSSNEKDLDNAIDIFNTLKGYKDSDTRAAECKKMYKENRNATLKNETLSLQTELANLKGLFSGKRRKEIEARLSQIETELKRLK